MTIEVDEDVRKKTTCCYKLFGCLTGNIHDMCEVQRPLAMGVTLVKSKSVNSCPYYVRIGESEYCTCPTRNQLYTRYGIWASLQSHIELKTVNYKIPDEKLKQTTRCQKNLGCLSGEVGNMCQVEFLSKSAPILFVDKVQDGFCSYCGQFRHSCLCSCPVRIELYNRYQI